MLMEEILFSEPSDLLDAYCQDQFGHVDWKMDFDKQGNYVVTFFKSQREEEEYDE
jgi:hypothetical protein